jgi:O-Antigen ligase
MWPRIACLLILGYLGMSRSFAYLGIPAWKLFISEVVFGFLLLFGPKIQSHRWLSVVLKLPAMERFLTWYGLFLAYGIVEVLHGVYAGYPPLTVIRDLAFNYYPLYFFLGLWAGLVKPDILPKVIRGFAWFNGIYGMLFILYLNRLDWVMPGVSADVSPVPIFGQPIYSFVALLGLLAYEKSLSRSWYLWVLNAFVMLGMQIRGEWAAFAVGVVIWGVLTRQGRRVLQAGAVLASLFAVMYFTDFRLPSPQGRAEEDFSAKQVVDRSVAPFRADVGDQKAAAGLGGADSQEATFVFRTVWWMAIWDSVHADLRTELFGYGYGFALGDLVPYLSGEFIRTPHNTFFYALGYTGWVGVALFTLFQIAIFRLLWGAYRADGDPLGIILWATMLIFSLATAFFEVPYGAIPFYLIAGCACAPRCFQQASVRIATNKPFNGSQLSAGVAEATG